MARTHTLTHTQRAQTHENTQHAPGETEHPHTSTHMVSIGAVRGSFWQREGEGEGEGKRDARDDTGVRDSVPCTDVEHATGVCDSLPCTDALCPPCSSETGRGEEEQDALCICARPVHAHNTRVCSTQHASVQHNTNEHKREPNATQERVQHKEASNKTKQQQNKFQKRKKERRKLLV
jgi:hypothetical protein